MTKNKENEVNMKWGHDQLQNDLAMHLSSVSDRMVWQNMQIGPFGSPRPDVYTIPKSYSKFMPVSYEIKISVSDFRSDITSGKWQKYLKFSSGVIFAVPSGLINKSDLPKGCGLIVRGDEGWRVLKAPTLNHVSDFPRESFIKLIIDGTARVGEKCKKDRSVNTMKIESDVRRRYGDEIAKALADRNKAEAELIGQQMLFKSRLDSEQRRYDQEKQRIKEQFAKEASEVDEQRVALCKALGIDADSSPQRIRMAIDKAIQAVDSDEVVKNIRRSVESMKQHIKLAEKSISKEEENIFYKW